VPPILYLFALTNLVIGTGAFVLTGILKPMGDSLGISVAAAGQAITAYAVASALLAPLAVVATGKWPRKRAIQFALLLFLAGSVVCALSTTLGTLLAGRVLMGVGAMFSALASGLVVAMVPAAMRARALAFGFLGISLSYAIGLPLGTWLGFAYGWHAPVILVAVCSVLALLGLSVFLPRDIQAPGASFAGLGDALRRPDILRVWLRTLLYFVAIFNVFAYVGPVLLALFPMPAQQLSFTLVLFGVSGVVGTFVGGWASDRFGAIRALRVSLAVFIATMACVPLTQGSYPLVAAVFVVWGVAGFSLAAPQQARLATLAPAQAPLLLSLNGSMIYLGTALGAAVSGALVDSLGFAKLAWVGIPFALVAYLTLWFDRSAPLAPPKAAPTAVP
jgi:MFS transporter, DHA1 family, inner membrane transport protein